MTPCCTNTVTPTMIKKGQVQIGDKIEFDDDVPVQSMEFEQLPQTPQPQMPQPQPQMPQPPQQPQMQQPQPQMPQPPQQPQMQQPQMQTQMPQMPPITYSQMTPYMNQVSMSAGSNPSFTLPQTPMDTNDFEETIDITDIQAYTGFLRTQIGRYMRIEQLIGSNILEDRFGFLVGIGTNFIILQEITTGNIMVIDLFSIKLTYVYYSEPVFPRL